MKPHAGVSDGGHTADCFLLAVFAVLSSTLPSLGLATTRCRCGPGFRVTEAAASLSGCWDLHRLDLVERNTQFDYFSLEGDNAILHVSHFSLVKFLLARQARVAASTLALKFLQGVRHCVRDHTVLLAQKLTSMVLCSCWALLGGGQSCYLSGNSVCFFSIASNHCS